MFVDFRNYDVTLTTSFYFPHGVSGHTFEMVEYYLGISQYTNLKPCILLADGTQKDDVVKAIKEKYDLVDDSIFDHIYEHHQPKILFTKTLLIVDGSFRLNNADVFADTVFLFRCAEEDFSYFNEKFPKTILMQDFDVYDERYGELQNVLVIDYKKKIFFDMLKEQSSDVSDVAMFYLTTNCRADGVDDVSIAMQKYGFTKKVILTNKPELFDDDAYQVPVSNLWDLFSTYIYTAVPRRLDCSPRFIAECKYYGKEVIYDIDYFDPGLLARRNDIANHGLDTISMKPTDLFFELLQNECK